MKQSEAVYKATHNVLAEHDITFEDGDVIKPILDANPSIRKEVQAIVTAGIVAGEVDFSESAHKKYPNPEKIAGYVGGMVSNWHRKDKRFNGGVVYTPANPGSRTGMSDPEIKNLKLLLKSGKLDTKQSKIAQTRVDEKTATIRAAKSKVDIDFSAIPSDLLESLGMSAGKTATIADDDTEEQE